MIASLFLIFHKRNNNYKYKPKQTITYYLTEQKNNKSEQQYEFNIFIKSVAVFFTSSYFFQERVFVRWS